MRNSNGHGSQFPGDKGWNDWPDIPDLGATATAVDAGLFHGAGSADALAATLTYANGTSANTAPVTTSGGSFPTIPPSPTPFTINVNWDASVTSAPAGFTSDIVAAVQYLESMFTDAVTVTVNVGYGEVANNSLGTALGASLTNMTSLSYSSLYNALKADNKTATDAAVVASLPSAASPISNATYWTSTAEAKALGLASGTTVDGSVGFGLSAPFTYGMTNTTGTVLAGTYDFFATAVHELTEIMGRTMQTGNVVGGFTGSYMALDLLHYSAAGTRDLSATTAGYFSVDGGTTNLGAFNIAAGGDAGDWSSTVSMDAFDAFASSGVLNTMSANDLKVMDAIGWDQTTSAPPVSTSTPTGVTVSTATSTLAAAQSATGLAAKVALAVVVQAGGQSSDAYAYTLGGTGAASFTLATANKVATLSTGASIVAGAAGGKLYALTVTAKDTTSGNSAPPTAIDVVVGGASGDTIALSSMAGIVAAAPTFIYGLAGADSLNATGLTGKVWFDGGAGADTMTGGSGVNDYEYGAMSDSTATAMDIITNFRVGIDIVDLTGTGTKFSSFAALTPSATTIAAGTAGWQVSGGNTFIYANSTLKSEALTAANMKIELVGNIALTSGSFVHL